MNSKFNVIEEILSKKFIDSNVSLSCSNSEKYILESLIQYKDNDNENYLKIFIENNFITKVISSQDIDFLKNLFGINKISKDRLDTFNDFFAFINVESNLPKGFSPFNYINFKDVYNFKYNFNYGSHSGETVKSLVIGQTVCLFNNKSYDITFQNNFKFKKDLTILPVPVISIFDDTNAHSMFAYNIYTDNIHVVNKLPLYFEYFFKENPIIDPSYHLNYIFNKFIDDEVLKKLSNDTPLKETLILLPPNDLDIKIDLVSMYTI